MFELCTLNTIKLVLFHALLQQTLLLLLLLLLFCYCFINIVNMIRIIGSAICYCCFSSRSFFLRDLFIIIIIIIIIIILLLLLLLLLFALGKNQMWLLASYVNRVST